MKLFFKISLALFALILIIAVGFAFTFNPNDYKEDIITLVKDKTGRELSISGDISLSFFPWIGIDLGAIEISNAKGFGKQPFAKMTHMQVRAKLWPLFKQKLEADTVVIEGLMLNLAKNSQGISNWDDLSKTTSKTEATANIKATAPDKTNNIKESPQNILGAIALNGLKIEQAQFNWHDQQTKQKITVKDINLSIGALNADTKIPFRTEFHLQENSIDAKVKFNSDILFTSDFQQFSFYDTQLSSDLKLAALKQRLSPQLNSALMHLNINKQTFTTKEFNLSEGAIKLQAQMSASKLMSTPYLNGQLNIQSFNVRELADRFSIKLPDMADAKALTQVSAELAIKGTFSDLELSSIKLTLDDSNLTGNAVYKPTPASSTVKLAIDTINIDRYLAKPVASEEKAVANKSANKISSQANEAILIPIGLLTAINVDADFKINEIQVMKTHWTNFHLTANSKNGLILINPLTMNGYDAKVKTDIKLRATKDNTVISGNLDIQKINAGKFLNDFTGKDKLKGQTSMEVSFSTSGVKLSQLKQNLNGNLKFNLQEGTLKGFDLNHQLNVLDAKIQGKSIPATPNPEETKIANLSASAAIKKGVLNNEDLRASTPLSRIAGQGTIDIANEKLNYTASVKFVNSTDIKADTPFEKINTHPLDVYISGSFDQPSIKADFQKAFDKIIKKDEIKQEFKKKEREFKEKIQNNLKNELEKLLKH